MIKIKQTEIIETYIGCVYCGNEAEDMCCGECHFDEFIVVGNTAYLRDEVEIED